MAARWLCVVLFSFFSAVHLSLQLHTYIHVSLYYYKYTCTVLPFEYAKAEQRLPYVVYPFFSFLLKWTPSLCDVVPIFFLFLLDAPFLCHVKFVPWTAPNTCDRCCRLLHHFIAHAKCSMVTLGICQYKLLKVWKHKTLIEMFPIKMLALPEKREFYI